MRQIVFEFVMVCLLGAAAVAQFNITVSPLVVCIILIVAVIVAYMGYDNRKRGRK